MTRPLSLIFPILLSVTTCYSQTKLQSRTELEKERALIQREINEVKNSLDQTHKNKRQTLGQIALLKKRLSLRQEAIQNINLQVNFIQSDMNNSWEEILKLKKELVTLRKQYAESTLYAYENRTNYDYLSFIFAAESFNDALKRIEYLKTYRKYRQERANNIVKTEILLENKIARLKVKRIERSDALTKQSEEKNILESEKKEKDDAVLQLQKHEKELKIEMIAKQRQDMKLTNAITAAIRRARNEDIKVAKLRNSKTAHTIVAEKDPLRKKSTDVSMVGTPGKSDIKISINTTTEIALTGNFEKDKGHLPWPLASGTISIKFWPPCNI